MTVMAVNGRTTQQLDPVTTISAMGAKATSTLAGTFTKLTNVVNLFEKVLTGATLLQKFMLSMLILVICIAFFVLLYVFIRVVRVRGFSIFGHKENLEQFMDGFYEDINKTRKVYQSISVDQASYGSQGNNLVDMLGCKKVINYFSRPDKEVRQDIDTYFKYRDIVKKEYWWYSTEIEDKFAKNGKTGKKYLEELIDFFEGTNGIRVLIKECVTRNIHVVEKTVYTISSINNSDYDKNTFKPSSDTSVNTLASNFLNYCKNKGISYAQFKANLARLIDLCLGLNILHLYMNIYFEDIKELHNNRRFSFFNYLIILIKPYVQTLIFDRIAEPWKETLSSKGFERKRTEFDVFYDKIGQDIKNIPRILAGDEKELENEKKKRRNAYKGDLVEGFGFIKGLLSIGEFFLTIFDVAFKLAKLVTKPMEIIPFIVKMILGFVIGLFLIIVHSILGIEPLYSVVYAIYYFITVIVIQIVMAAFNVLLFSLFAVFSTVLWVLDLMFAALNGWRSHSFVFNMGLCENLPDIWHTRANFVKKNKYNRVALFTQSPCADRFEPNGVLCSRVSGDEPSYCPQAQVYRIYKGMKHGPNPFAIADFTPSAQFWVKNKEGRRAEVEAHFIKKQKYLSTCAKENNQFNNLVKNICANYDTVKLPNDKDRENLAKVCKQIYCDVDTPAEFCHKFDNKVAKQSKKELILDQDDVIQRIIKTIVIIIITLMVILMFLYNS